ncbi:BRO family protein [Sorlinia euscelidii]|uniref:BRO family protein n=1 Tax=Sorlinia euscelidii TaxID=3081148 RepID=UPI003AAD72E4
MTICHTPASHESTGFFEGQPIRIVIAKGEPRWALSDVCRALSITNARNVAAKLDDDEKDVHLVDTLGGPQATTFINESGLYALILTSRKPAAKRFKKWVTAEVLPTIRKTGGYMVAAPNETPEELAHRALTVLNDTLRRKDAEIATLEPKALAFDSLINNGELPSLRTFFKQFHELNLNAISETLGELGYLRRSDRYAGQWEVRRSHPRAAALFRQRINQGLKWNYVTVLLTPLGQEEMARLYRQGAFPKLVRFSH